MESIWTKDIAVPEFAPLQGDDRTDVLIVGGGLAGLLCAYRLKKAGVDCMLIEADRICQGVSRNTTAKITSQHGLVYGKLLGRFGEEKARLYYEANQKALAAYKDLAGSIECDFEEKDSYIYGVSSVSRLEKEMQALQKLHIPGEFTEETPLPFLVAGAVRFRDQGQFHPLKFAAGIAKELPIYEQTAAREFKGNRVVTDRGTITAEKVIIATHFPLINKHGGYFLKMYQQRSYVLALEGAEDIGGMYLDERASGLSLRSHGKYLLVGGGSHRTGKETTGWQKLETFGRIYYPGANTVRRWAAQDCMTLDNVPYIGQYGRCTPNLYVATGFNKWGMTNSMVSAMVLEELVQGRPSAYEELFSPQRSSLRKQLFLNMGESAANILTFRKPRCPHLGCALKWNRRERSWDCPCHGSRFDREGKLMDNPATGDLKKKP